MMRESKAPLSAITPEERLALGVRTVYDRHTEFLEHLRSEGKARWHRPDWIWESLLLAFATLGSSRGVRLVEEARFRDPVRYRALLKAPRPLSVLKGSLHGAGVRYADQKATQLRDNFQRVKKAGGPAAVRRKLEAEPGRERKMSFLRQFSGIGPKYARDIMMDAYHPEFLDSVAVDARVTNVVKALGSEFGTGYKAEEEFLLSVARRAGITGWDVDRVLYWFGNEVLFYIRNAARKAKA